MSITLLILVNALEKAGLPKVTAAPAWFTKEFGAGALNGIVSDKTGDAGFWRAVSVALRIEKRS